jgi:hypothetical protein
VKILDPAPATARHLIYVMVQEKLISETDATHALAKVIELAEAADRNEEPGKAGLQNIPDIELISSGDPQPLKNICRQLL